MAVSAPGRTTILDYLRFFRAHAGGGVVLYLILSFIASYVDGVSFVLFLPLLNQSSTAGTDPLSVLVAKLLGFFHVSATPDGVVPLLIFFFVLKSLLQFWLGARQYAISTRMTRNVRGKIVRGLAVAEYEYVQSLGAGAMSNIVNTETSRAVSACLYLSRLPPIALNVVVFASIIAYLNPALALMAGLCGVAAFFALRIPGRLTERASIRVTQDSGVLNGLLIELVEGYRYLRGTASFEPVEHHIGGAVARLAESLRRIGVLYTASSSLAQPIVVIFLGGLILYHHRAGHSIAPLLVLLMYLYRILTDLLTAQTWWQEARSFAGGILVVRETLDKLDAHRETRGHVSFEKLVSGIELRDVEFSYGERVAIDRISLTIPRHATIAFVGESGAGKSTMVDLLCGTLRPSNGVVLVDGTPLRELDPESYRRRVGYVPQSYILFEDTIANNITLWRDDAADPIVAARIEKATQDALCADFIRSLPERYETRLRARGENLSGGQRQRIAIARELYKQPSLLILDEATSALDAESEVTIRRELERLKGSITIVLVTHRLASALDADHIYVLRDGRVVEHGTGASLLADEASWFRRMYEQQRHGVTA